MSTMVYQWKPDSRFPIAAQIAAERLNLIRDREGDLTPQAVVEDAVPESSPLHRCFTWDDAAAADKFRLAEARKLIGSVVVVQMGASEIRKETRAFVHTITDDNPRYEPVEYVASRPDMREETLSRAKQEIAIWRSRYAAYNEFFGLCAKIDELLAAD